MFAGIYFYGFHITWCYVAFLTLWDGGVTDSRQEKDEISIREEIGAKVAKDAGAKATWP